MPMRGLVLGILVLAAAAPAVAAQGRPIRVRGVRPLTFGLVLPGVPRLVPRTDPVGSGEFDVRGQRNSPVLLQLTLPPSLTGPGGAAMPVTFGPNDAGYSDTGAIGAQVGFDPNVGGSGVLSKNGQGSVFLGGTVRPTTGQPAGAYTGTVVLTVTML